MALIWIRQLDVIFSSAILKKSILFVCSFQVFCHSFGQHLRVENHAPIIAPTINGNATMFTSRTDHVLWKYFELGNCGSYVIWCMFVGIPVCNWWFVYWQMCVHRKLFGSLNHEESLFVEFLLCILNFSIDLDGLWHTVEACWCGELHTHFICQGGESCSSDFV